MKFGRCIVLSVFFLISLVFVVSALAGFELHPCNVFNDIYGTAGTRLDATVSSGCLICHMVESNPYGSDIYDYLRECFETSICDEATIEGAIRNVEPLDSDGDGYNNITEINNLTFPGDPNDYPVYASQWTKIYHGGGADYARSVQQTSDGGYIVVAHTLSFGAGDYDIWVLKLDAIGNVQWQKTYGGSRDDYGESIQQTSDGGYIVIGYGRESGVDNYRIWVLKLDANGDVLWLKTYGGDYHDEARSIQQTSDGGYIVAGWTFSFGAGGADAWILKLDANGNIQWQKTYGSTYYDEAYSIEQTSDGGYTAVGYTYSLGTGSYDIWVLKLDGNGNVQWQKTYSGSGGHDTAKSIQQTSDGGYVVVGYTYFLGTDSYDSLVLKLDSSGNVQWQKTYGSTSSDYAYYIQQTMDGGYIVAGETQSFGAGYGDAWVLKLDGSGNIQWQKTYGGTSSDYAYSIQQTSDGGYIAAGYTSSFGNDDAWVLKLNGSGDIPDCSIIGTSNATVNNTSATTTNANAIGTDTAVYPWTILPVVTDTNSTVTDICSPPIIGYSPISFIFTATQGRSNPPNQTLSISNTGVGTLTWSVTDNATWLSLSPTSGTDSGTVTLSVNITGLTAGTYNATITITAVAAINSPVDIPVTLIINVPTSASHWIKAYGGNIWDEVFSTNSVHQTSPDGEYIVAGNTGSFGTGSSDFWMLKLDTNGNVLWQKTYGESLYDYAESIQRTFHGGYVVAGWTNSFGAGNYDFLVLRLDSSGNVLWQNTYGGSGNDYAYSIQQTSDLGYIVAGDTESFGAGGIDAWILRLDANGNVLWQKTYGGIFTDHAESIQQTTDGGYIVFGITASFGTGNGDFWVLKLDASGNVLWQKTYGGSSFNVARSIQQTSDNGYIIAGMTQSFGAGSGDAWVLKLDINGNVQWQKTYGGSDFDGAAIQQTSDGGYIMVGRTASFGAGSDDVWVLKLDTTGNVQWQKTYGGSDSEITPTIRQTSDGGYIAAGVTYSFGAGNRDVLVLKLDSNGDIPGCSIAGTSNAEVTNSSATITNTSVTGINTTVSPQTSAVTVVNTNATVTDVCFSSGPEVLTLFSPNGGEIIPSGSPYTIQWGAPTEAVRYDIGYSLDDGASGTWKLIASNITDYSYNWTVPVPDGNKNTCRVGVRGYNASGGVVGTDTSDNPFKIEVVKLTYPNGGETLISGNTYQITWQTNSTIRPVQSVKIYGSPNQGQSGTWRLLTTISGNPGYYDWRVPTVGTTKDKCRLGVLLLDSTSASIGQDGSDNNFTIQPAP